MTFKVLGIWADGDKYCGWLWMGGPRKRCCHAHLTDDVWTTCARLHSQASSWDRILDLQLQVQCPFHCATEQNNLLLVERQRCSEARKVTLGLAFTAHASQTLWFILPTDSKGLSWGDERLPTVLWNLQLYLFHLSISNPQIFFLTFLPSVDNFRRFSSQYVSNCMSTWELFAAVSTLTIMCFSIVFILLD